MRSRQFSGGWGDLAWVRELGSARAAFRSGVTGGVAWSRRDLRAGLVITDGTFAVDMPALPLPAGALPARVRRVCRPGAEPDRAVVVLAASREEGYTFRHLLWDPLAREGVDLYFLENPLYGARRAEGRRGAPVRTVSEQLAMNLASVAEATALAAWLASSRRAVGVAGYSMGAYMAAATVAIAPRPVAAAILAGGLSPEPVYTRGLLSRSVDLAALAGPGGDREAARARLGAILAQATVRDLPRPARPDAVILVANTRDGFVPLAEATALHELWPGTTLRLLQTGHAGAPLLHRPALRAALRDALARVAQAAPAS